VIDPIASPYLVPFDGSFRVADAPTAPPEPADKKTLEKQLKKTVKKISELQRKLYADDRFGVLLMFQAMDAAGKDGTIRAVTSGVNPAGFQVHAFKRPSAEELDHDFLWRTSKALPERGRIGIFNRSYYEEVLVVRVHPGYLGGQKLPHRPELDELWAQRLESLRDHEKHLARNGKVIIKFWLNVSHAEQHRRFVDRIDEPEKNWKFSAGDVAATASPTCARWWPTSSCARSNRCPCVGPSPIRTTWRRWASCAKSSPARAERWPTRADRDER
jgi:PPK2 family polyphosphate:nucleotide phosphotransferase